MYRCSIILALFFLSCKDPKFVRKNITDGNIDIKWYYHSNLTNNNPDIVDVSKNDSVIQILKADEIIVDIVIDNKDIIIKTFKNAGAYIYSDSITSEAFGYKIILDSTLPTHDKYHVPRNVTKEYF